MHMPQTYMIPASHALRDKQLIAKASLEAMLAVEGGQHADRALNMAGRRFRLAPEDRLAVKLWLYHTLRWRERFDGLLRATTGPWDDSACRNAARLALSSVFEREADPELVAALEETLALRDRHGEARLLRPVTMIAEATAHQESLAETHSHPEWMVQLLTAQYPDELIALLQANNAEPPITLCVNPLKIDREDLQQVLAKEGIDTVPGIYSPLALHLVTPADVYRSQAFRDGLFQQQDEAAQLLGFLAASGTNGLLVDALAAGGEYTLQIAALLQNRGRVLATEAEEERLIRIGVYAQRAGIRNVDVQGLEAGGIPTPLVEKADTVLLEAPNSGLGVLRRNPDAKWRLDASAIEELAARQTGLLALWAQAVKPGGLLVYATATVTRQENQSVVEQFLATQPGFHVEPAQPHLPGAAASFCTPEGYYQSMPHRHGTDGLFAVRLRRKA